MDLTGRGILVFCASSDLAQPQHREAARALGEGIGRAGAKLVYGGASVGLMGILADATKAAGGHTIGVIPRRLVEREVAHRGLDELIVVDTMHQRKAHMSARADAYVVLPGGFGTYDELFEVVTWKQLGMHDRPIVLCNISGFYDPVRAQIDRGLAEGVIQPAYKDLLTIVATVDEALAVLAAAPVPTKPAGAWF